MKCCEEGLQDYRKTDSAELSTVVGSYAHFCYGKMSNCLLDTNFADLAVLDGFTLKTLALTAETKYCLNYF